MIAALLAVLSWPQEPSSSPLVLARGPSEVRVVEGPVVLRADLDLEWGGHTFSYLVEGERGVFWCGKAVGETGPAWVGQFPAPGSDLEPRLAELGFEDERATRVYQPQLVRTPDGHLHAFVGYLQRYGRYERGRLRYYRTERPEDVTSFVDRSECLPKEPVEDFAPRMNVGIDRTGARLVLQILTVYVPGKSNQNLPLLFVGRREGLDFRFAPPVAWSREAVPFFYPQVAATDEGPVLLGSVADDPSRFAELVHLSWEGEVLLRRALPRPEGRAQSWACELEPFSPDDWSRLLLVRAIVPKAEGEAALELWEYDARSRRLERLRRFASPVEGDLAITNAGQVLVRRGRPPLLVSEPSSRMLCAWEGDPRSDAPMRLAPLPRTEVRSYGYAGIRSVFVPSVLQGSIPWDPGGARTRAVAVDTSLGLPEGATGPCSLLLWRLSGVE